MIDDFELGSQLFGKRRVEERADKIATSVMYGKAVADSVDGTVRVVLDGDTTAPAGGTSEIELPTSPSVKEGDTVMVTLTGGVAKAPMVTAVTKSGDRIKGEIDDFKEYAEVEYTHESTFDEVTGAISNTITANYSATAPNLTPFFSHGRPASGTSDDYWNNLNAAYTILEDGWAHFENDRTGKTGTVFPAFSTNAQPFIVAGKLYTLLVEIKNISVTGTGTGTVALRPHLASSKFQLPGSSTGANTIDLRTATAGSYYIPCTAADDISGRVGMLYSYVHQTAESNVSFDFRVSLYEGEYAGAYKPYSLSQAEAVQSYATQSYVSQTADAIELEVSQTYLSQADASTTYATKSALEIATDSISSLVQGNATYTDPVSGQTVTSALGTQVTQTASDVSTLLTDVGGIQTMIRETTDGILVAKVGDTIGALVNANGSFDVVEVSWSGNTPTAGSALASFGENSLELGVSPASTVGSESTIDLNGGNLVISTERGSTTMVSTIKAVSSLLDSLYFQVGSSIMAVNESLADAGISFEIHPSNNPSALPVSSLGLYATESQGEWHGRIHVNAEEINYSGWPRTTRSGDYHTDPTGVHLTAENWSQYGLTLEQDEVFATAEVVTVPIQISTTQNVTWNNHHIANVPLIYAPPCQIRVPVFTTANWSSMPVGYVAIDTDGKITALTSATSVMFGVATYVRGKPSWMNQ